MGQQREETDSRVSREGDDFGVLEPYDGKLSRTVLRGERSRKAPDLPGDEMKDHMTTKSQSSKWMDKIVSDYVTPTLKEEGFRKRGRTFTKEVEDIIKVLEIQSGWNSPTTAYLTINLGVVFPRVWDVINGGSRPENPVKIQWTVNQRIGLLMPCSTDMWWSLKKAADLDTKGPELRSVIIDYALPFLNKTASASDLLTLYVQNPENWGDSHWAQLHAAIIANNIGDNRYARSMLLELLNGMSTTVKVEETNIYSDGTKTTKIKELSNIENINFVRQCAERMAIEL